MSLGTRARSARSSGRAAPAKKAKKLKSEARAPKKRAGQSKEVNIEEVRGRVAESLQHLGRQTFSNEPGGYNLTGWLKSLKTLLDDFEDKASDLPEIYHAKREEVEKEFSTPADTTKLDDEIEGIRKEEVEIRTKMQEEAERITARLSAIGSDKMNKAKELEDERARLKSVQDEKRSASFFSKLMGRAGPDTLPIEKKVGELEKGLKMLEDEALNLQTVRKSLEGRTNDGGLHDGLWNRLEELGKRLEGLESARQLRQQLGKEREEATESLRRIITELKFETKEA